MKLYFVFAHRVSICFEHAQFTEKNMFFGRFVTSMVCVSVCAQSGSMYVCSFYLFTANAHKAANANVSCCFNGTRNTNCEHSQVNHTVFFQNEINKVANGTFFSDMKSKHIPLLILIVFLFYFGFVTMFMWKFDVLHKHGNSSAPPHEK